MCPLCKVMWAAPLLDFEIFRQPKEVIVPAKRVDPPVDGAYVPFHNYDGYDFGGMPSAPDRLNQGPFGIDQDEGWHTLMVTTPARGPVPNFGMGLMGYPWEENGAPPTGEPMETSVEKLARLPFVDTLYIRCDWRDVQRRKGRLDLNPVFAVSLALAKELSLGVGIRIQMSSPNIHPELSIPKFIADKMRFASLGDSFIEGEKRKKWREPDYTDKNFQKAFRELNELLVAEFDDNVLVEWVDLMQYGLWGEGHTGSTAATGIAPYADLLETFATMTRLQLELWKKTPLAVNTQPDISRAGNDYVHDIAIRGGAWLRTDSIVSIEESQQIEMHANRPPYLASIVEDGGLRGYQMDKLLESADGGVTNREFAALHALDVGANYWSLWQMADNLAAFDERFPRCFSTAREKIGYRVRPSWIIRRKRYGRNELIVILKNDGIAGVPGRLKVWVEDKKRKVKVGGSLDAGHPYAGKLRHASFLLPDGVDYEGLKIRAEVETKGVVRPIRWACEQSVNKDGSLDIAPNTFTRFELRKDQ